MNLDSVGRREAWTGTKMAACLLARRRGNHTYDEMSSQYKQGYLIHIFKSRSCMTCPLRHESCILIPFTFPSSS